MFGEDALARPLTLDDLEHEDKESLKEGYIQRLPVRDKAGRAVFCFIKNGQTYESGESLCRIFFYLACSGDEETDKQGCVVIYVKLEMFNFKRRHGALAVIWLSERIITALPWRFEAAHQLVEPVNTANIGGQIIRVLLDFLAAALLPKVLARVMMHIGMARHRSGHMC